MYEAYFGLHQRPFTAAPEADCYFPSRSAETARLSLARTIERAEGIGLLIGAPGTGKTLLCRVLASQFRDRFQVAMLTSGRLGTRRALLQAILFELDLPYRGLEEGELRLSLIDHLSPRGPAHNAAADVGLVLIVDEAHTLPLRLLEELRMITNLVRDGLPRVRLVLAGSPKLEERFSSPKLESFNQRVAARCYLTPLAKDETFQFVQSAIESSGGSSGDLFSSDALEAIFQSSEGIPRLINQIGDHALILACAGDHRQIGSSEIEEAWADLQQLPTPWNQAGRQELATESVIEFGGLSDEPNAVPFRSNVESTKIEPAEQIEAIQHQLDEMDDELEFAGSIGPQVVLNFSDESNPFDELFMEEEVIIDHYAMLDAGLLENLPLVRSREGTELGGMLAPFVQPQPKPRLSIAKQSSVNDTDESARPKTVPTPIVAKQVELAPMPAPQNAAAATVRPIEQIETPPTPIVAVDDAHDEIRSDEEVHQLQDHDLIVVESEPQEDIEPVVNEEPQRQVMKMQRQVRRQEYRQLFARLRRG